MDNYDNLRQRKASLRRLKRSRYVHDRVRYRITLQWRRGSLRPGGDPMNWRDWREFGHIPILFYSEEEAWDYIGAVDIFKNLNRRKASASVDRVILKGAATP